jgi:hypothetical protein
VRGATAFATKIEINDVAQSFQSNLVAANHQFRRAPRVGVGQLC